jgi:hypothetical protein
MYNNIKNTNLSFKNICWIHQWYEKSAQQSETDLSNKCKEKQNEREK